MIQGDFLFMSTRTHSSRTGASEWRWFGVFLLLALAVFIWGLFELSTEEAKERINPTPTTASSESAQPTPTISIVEPTPTASSSEPALTEADGDRAYQDRYFDDALAAYHTALLADETNPRLWLKLGNTQRELDQALNALLSYEKARDHDPLLGDAYLNAAAILWSQGKRDEARTVLKAGISAGASRLADLQSTLSVYESLP